MTLSYLKIEIWGFPYPPNKVELNYSDGKIAYSFDNRLQYSREGEYFDFDCEKRTEIEDFLSTFKKRLYTPKGQVLDGEYWELEFRYEGEEKPHRKRGEMLSRPFGITSWKLSMKWPKAGTIQASGTPTAPCALSTMTGTITISPKPENAKRATRSSSHSGSIS